MIKSMIYAAFAAKNININVAKTGILEKDIAPIAATTPYDTTISIITLMFSPYIIKGIADNANVSTISQSKNRLSVSFIYQFVIFFIVPEFAIAVAFFIVVFPFTELIAEVIFRIIEVCNPSLASGTAIFV